MELTRFYTTEQLSPRMAETPEGFLVCYSVPLARTGEYVYKASEVPVEAGSDGLVKIQRDEDEVFSEETIRSFEGKSVTINHPNDFVTPENWTKIANGVVQNVHRGDGEQSDLLIGDLVITTQDAIRLVKAGLRQVSAGYDAQYEQIEPGLGKQTNIIGNHVALVVKGRAGSRCAIMDTACKCCGNCLCDEKKLGKEDNSKMKNKVMTRETFHKMFPKINLTLVKDQDLEMGEENPVMENPATQSEGAAEIVQTAAAEMKEAAIQVVNAAKEVSEAASQVAAGGAIEERLPIETDQEEGSGEVEGDPIAVLGSKLDSVLSLLQQLVDAVTEEEGGGEEQGAETEGQSNSESEGSEEEFHDGYKEGKIYGDEGEDLKIAEKMSGENCGLETKDRMWQDTISRAEIIAPGIIATKPRATDLKKVTAAVKRRALNTAMTKDHANIVKPLLRGRKISSLTEDALDTAFVAASEMIGRINNSRIHKGSMQMKDLSSHNEIAAINAKNREYWKGRH